MLPSSLDWQANIRGSPADLDKLGGHAMRIFSIQPGKQGRVCSPTLINRFDILRDNALHHAKWLRVKMPFLHLAYRVCASKTVETAAHPETLDDQSIHSRGSGGFSCWGRHNSQARIV